MANDGEDFNTRVIREFHENDGQVGPPFQGLPMILLHHVGARTGTERTTPLRWFDGGSGRYVVVASKAGAPDNPAWYHNLRANPDVTVEVGHGPAAWTETLSAHAEELTGDERASIWKDITAENEGFAEYERRTEGIRTIPLVAFTPSA